MAGFCHGGNLPYNHDDDDDDDDDNDDDAHQDIPHSRSISKAPARTQHISLHLPTLCRGYISADRNDPHRHRADGADDQNDDNDATSRV